jgi:hypothetical protein
VVDAVGRLIVAVGKRLATEDPDDLVLLPLCAVRTDVPIGLASSHYRKLGGGDGQ